MTAILGINTDEIQSGAKIWQFQRGTSGNPKGRPLGSRNKSTLAMLPLTATDLALIEEMDKPALIALIKRASAANWGLFMQTHEQVCKAVMDNVVIMALRSQKPHVRLGAIKYYLDRTEGKPKRQR